MTKIEISMDVVAESAFTEPGASDTDMAGSLLELARMAGVGDPTVERRSTRRWIVRDQLGNVVGSAELCP